MKRSIFFILFCLACCNLFGQTNYLNHTNVIPPSPDAAGLMRYVSVPVNHSTGVPDISIPLYKLEQGTLSLPISISYHAGGIRVRDIASVIGLGWSLQAGGLISRSVVGTHDENAVLPPYRSSSQITNAQNTMTGSLAINLASELNQMDQHFSEYMTDRYGFNFNGNGGTFRNIKSSTGEDLIYIIPYKPWKIEKKYESGSLPAYQRQYYVITDDTGIQYEFKNSERTNGVITGWRLVKITSADLTDEIRFYYSGLESMSVHNNSHTVEAGNTIDDPDGGWRRLVEARNSSIGATNFEVQQLDSIVSKNESVNFYYLKDRFDGRTTRLQRIKVQRGTEIVRDVSFNQSYFGSAADHTARMRLDSIGFNDASGISIERYGFTYNTDIDAPGYYYTSGYVPPEKIREDYWGYYNGPSGGGLPAEFLSFLTANEAIRYNGNRNPSVFDMKAYILKEMKLPTGGKTVFEFECNETNDPTFYGYSSPHGGIVGGLRVKNIKYYLADNVLAETKSYTYDEHGLFQRIQANLFQYMYFKRFFNRIGEMVLAYASGDQMFTGCSSVSNYPLSVLDHSPIFYSKVTEYNGTELNNSGKTVYHYQLPENPTIGGNGSLLPPWKIGLFQSDKGDISSLLSKVETYERVGSGYKLRSKKENNYTQSVDNKFITGIFLYQDPIYIENQTLSRSREPSSAETWAVYNGSFHHEDLVAHQFVRYLSSTTDSAYFDNLPPVGRKTNFVYNNLSDLVPASSTATAVHSQPLQKSVENSKGATIITTYTYPNNYSGSPYTTMVQKNQINSVIEKKEFKSNIATTPIGGEKVDYAIWNGNSNQIYPSSFYKFRSDLAAFEKRENILGYDLNGNLISFSKISNVPTVLIWGYNGAYPVAKIENASHTDIFAYTGFESSEKGGWTYTGARYTAVKHSGKFAYLLNSGSSISKTGLDATKIYQLNVFVAGSNSPVVSGGTLLSSKSFPGSVWTRHEFVLKNASSVTVSSPSSISMMVDDISLHPQNARITTYTFGPVKGMTSKTDVKGIVEYYDYDGFQRLKSISDVDRNVIKSFDYNYKR